VNTPWLILGGLAVWRCTYLLHAEDGPWRALARMRARLGSRFFSELFGCFYCLSLWVALVPALLIGDGWLQKVLLWPGLSAAAIVLERIVQPPAAPPVAIYTEDEET
jgi:hypothetical protein